MSKSYKSGEFISLFFVKNTQYYLILWRQLLSQLLLDPEVYFFLMEGEMFVRSLAEIEATKFFVDWGNGTSHRLLTETDQMGFTVCHTIVRAGTESRLQYRNHLEACYCIDGEGEIEDGKGNVFPIKVGDIYVLDQHDYHYLRAATNTDLTLVSVFNPPLQGTECHDVTKAEGSAY